MTMTEDLYEILGINKTSTKAEIKKAYRSKAKVHHPDKGGSDEMFKKVSYAYDVLSDDNKRSRYDSMGHDGLKVNQGGGGHPSGFDAEFIKNFFRDQQQQQQQSRFSIKVKLNITVEEAFLGVTKTFQYDRQAKCEPCKGRGGSNPRTCTNCSGSGKHITIIQTAHGHMQQISDCQVCAGVGELFDDICTSCGGNGLVLKRENVEINVPRSIISGENIIKAGMGHMGPNNSTGDLIVIVEILLANEFQITPELNLISMIKVPYEILLIGGKVEWTTIDKTKIRVSVPPLSKLGDKLRVKGKGMFKRGSKDVRTDQLLVLDIEIPTSITDAEKEILESLKKLKE